MPSPPSTFRTRFFTICAANYLANAIVLGRSIASAHPGARLTVFLLDALPAECAGLEHLDVVPAAATMPAAAWHHYQCFYTVIEVATGIKPLCFEYLLDQGCDLAIYLDADIEVFGRFDKVVDAARRGHEIVLTPHVLTPLPDDGALPDDLRIMQAGIYNLGFAAFANAPRARAFLAWWGAKLRTQGLVDVASGLFTDQKWVDYAPALCESTFILRDPGHNVAYWNLHERTLRRQGDGWRVDFAGDGAGGEAPLVFYHFSGFSPAVRTLSKHETRFGGKAPGDANALLEQYGQRLVAAGHDLHSKRKVAEPRFDSGPAWDPVCRMLYRDILEANPGYGDPLQGDDFFDFATRHAAGDHLPRYLRAVLALRPDVARAYDDGRNRVGLSRWLASDGVAQLGADPALLGRLGFAGDVLIDAGVARNSHADAGNVQAGAVAGTAREGVNVVGYFRAHLGVGEAARNMVAALRAVGLEVATHDVSRLAPGIPTGDYDVGGRGATARHGTTILGVNADETPRVLASLPAGLRATRLVGHWAWETPDFPEAWCDRFALLDEVWAASSFVAEALRAKATVPVLVVPYAVQVPPVAPDRAWLARLCADVEAGEFIFTCFFDVGSMAYRKNPQGAVAAFLKAFRPEEPVRLIVKVLNGERDPALIASLAAQARGQRITLLDATLESMDRFRLLASADAFVSLHRSEGFGLVIAEAMALRRSVVVTNWSGNADFTTPQNAAIVAHRPVRSLEAHGPYAAGTLWAEPDLDDAARQMRRVWEDGPWRASLGEAAAQTIATRFSPAVVGGIIEARLERLAASAHRLAGARAGAGAPLAPATPHIAASVAFRTVAADMIRRPVFYLARVPRVPAMIARDGFGSVLDRLAHKARDRDDSQRRKSSLRAMMRRFWSFLRGPRHL